jgi:hypothetical protein
MVPTSRIRRSIACLAVLVSSVAVTAGRCTTPKETLQLIEGAESVVTTVGREPLPTTQLSAIDNQVSQLRKVDVSMVTDADAARIQAATANLQRMSRDVNVAASYTRAAESAWAKATITALPASAEGTARDSITIANPKPEFIADLKDVTEDAITGVLCDQILDIAFPKGPPSGQKPGLEADWQGSFSEAAITLVARRFSVPAVRSSVEWGFWMKGVTDKASTIRKSLASDLATPITFEAHPALPVAAAYYPPICLAPPKK